MLLYHRVGEFEATGPVAVLGTAQELQGEAAEVDVTTVARSRFSVQTASDLTLTPAWAFASAPSLDALIVPGGPGVDRALKDRALMGFIAEARATVQILASVGSGSVLLGAAGALRDQDVCGPPELLDRLEDFNIGRRLSAAVVINPSGLWCAATMDAGLDLALELVARAVDADLAAATARAIGRRFGSAEMPLEG